MRERERERVSRGETVDRNVTRQPKSCYATADLLTHISRKGTGETGAKCPAAHNTRAVRAKRQKGHPADPLTQRQLTRAATGKGEESFFFSVGRFLLKGHGKEETGARQLLCRGSLNVFVPLLRGKVGYNWAAGCRVLFLSAYLHVFFKSFCAGRYVSGCVWVCFEARTWCSWPVIVHMATLGCAGRSRVPPWLSAVCGSFCVT